jgi:fission process protein 1
MANGKDKKDEFADIPHEREGTRPNASTLPARKKLPKELQATLDSEEKLWDLLYEGKYVTSISIQVFNLASELIREYRTQDTTDTSIRYAAYASRVRTIMLSAHRYVAYTSDIGESFRPIAHPYFVRGAYAVSWLYLTGDVAHEGYKAYMRNQKVLHPELHTEQDTKTEAEKSSKMAGALQKMGEGLGVKPGEGNPLTGGQVVPGRVSAIEDYRTVMAQRAVFQAVASMGLPAFTIHSIVRYSGRALKDVKNTTLRTWGPIGVSVDHEFPQVYEALTESVARSCRRPIPPIRIR